MNWILRNEEKAKIICSKLLDWWETVSYFCDVYLMKSFKYQTLLYFSILRNQKSSFLQTFHGSNKRTFSHLTALSLHFLSASLTSDIGQIQNLNLTLNDNTVDENVRRVMANKSEHKKTYVWCQILQKTKINQLILARKSLRSPAEILQEN